MLAAWESDDDLTEAPAILVEVARRVDLSFDGRALSTETVVLASGVATAAWRSGVLEVLVHATNGFTATATMWVDVHAVELDPIDPAVELLGPLLTSVRISSSTAPGELILGNLGVAASMARVSARWTQDADEAGGVQTAAVSIRLVGRRR